MLGQVGGQNSFQDDCLWFSLINSFLSNSFVLIFVNAIGYQVGKKQPLLARAEDSSADPSPKKHKTGNSSSTNRSKRSRLEERLSKAELQYIDSGSPDQVRSSIYLILTLLCPKMSDKHCF